METKEKFRGKYNVQSNRLQGYDYSSAGAYFITICTKNREHFFGEIIDDEMVLNDLGRIVVEEWQRTPKIRENIILDEFVVMPNHVHGILFIDNNQNTVETNCNLSLQKNILRKKLKHGTSQTIGSIVRGFKIGVTKYAREKTGIFNVWQRNYYDRIIRNAEELNKIREYIIYNPQNWADDELY